MKRGNFSFVKLMNAVEQLEKENYTVKQLEKILIEQYSDYCDYENIKPYALLYLRKRKLNSIFKWTPKDIDKILDFDKKLNECLVIAYNDAKRLIPKLNKRINDKNDLFNDFEIELSIIPFNFTNDENDRSENIEVNTIEDILDNFVEYFHIFLNYSKWEEELKEFHKKDWNWNNQWPFFEQFKNHFISTALYRFIQYTEVLSISDILKIQRLWLKLNVDYQYDVIV